MSDFDLDPRLSAFIDAAKAMPAREPRVDPNVIAAAAHERRVGRRRTIVASTTTALVAAAAMLLALRPQPDAGPTGDVPQMATADSTSSQTMAAGESIALATNSDPAAGAPLRASPPAGPVGSPSLAIGHAALGSGSHQLVLADAQSPRAIETPAGTLVLEPGTELEVDILDGVVAVHVERGVAAFQATNTGEWVEFQDSYRATAPTDGAATVVALADANLKPAGPSASELAREAELALASGDRKQAMKLLRKIAVHHRRSPEAHAALLDLGRLLEKTGRKDEARCAYGLYLQRWPTDALASTVRTRQAALGDGPECKGMRPQIKLK